MEENNGEYVINSDKYLDPDYIDNIKSGSRYLLRITQERQT